MFVARQQKKLFQDFDRSATADIKARNPTYLKKAKKFSLRLITIFSFQREFRC